MYFYWSWENFGPLSRVRGAGPRTFYAAPNPDKRFAWSKIPRPPNRANLVANATHQWNSSIFMKFQINFHRHLGLLRLVQWCCPGLPEKFHLMKMLTTIRNRTQSAVSRGRWNIPPLPGNLKKSKPGVIFEWYRNSGRMHNFK